MNTASLEKYKYLNFTYIYCKFYEVSNIEY